MSCQVRRASRVAGIALLFVGVSCSALAQAKKPAAKPAAPAAKPAAAAAAAKPGGAASALHPGGAAGAAKPGGITTAGARPGGITTAGARPGGGITTAGARPGGVTTAGARPGMTAGGARPAGFAAGGRPGAPGGRPALAEHGAMARPGGAHDRDVRLSGGGAARFRPGGRPAEFHDERRGLDVHHNLVGGGHRMEMERPDHSRLMYERGRRGYISHPYGYRGHDFARRSYYFHGRAYNRFYEPYGWRGARLDVYAPMRYYPAAYYGWAYNPWARPYPYAWGFAGAPWYGYYGPYFSPYPVYGSASLWLTDYLISQDLAAGYEAAAASGPPPAMGADAAPMTPEVKQMVADEVQRQLALENSEAQLNQQGQPPDPASSSISRMLSDGQPHAFIAGSEVDVVDSTGAECALTDGDVLQLTAPPPPTANDAQLVVMASKGGQECRKMSTVTVSFEDLQEMQNHMRETVDQGLADLQAKQGKGGLPTAPPSAMAPPSDAAFAAGAPPPEPGGDKELAAQAQAADTAEQQQLASVAPADAAPGVGAAPVAAPAPVTTSTSISPGQTTTEVTAALGQPKRIVNLGGKTIYFYDGMKVTFKAGKVSDIE